MFFLNLNCFEYDDYQCADKQAFKVTDFLEVIIDSSSLRSLFRDFFRNKWLTQLIEKHSIKLP